MGYVMLSQPAIEPVGQSRSDVDIIAQLSKELGLGDDLLESGFDACLDWMLEPSVLSVAELKKHPAGMFVPDFKKPAERKYVDQGFKTPSGKFEFISGVLSEMDGEGFEALPSFREPAISPVSQPEIAKEYPFVLSIGARKPMFQHSRTFRIPWIRQFVPDPACDMNPADAKRIGIAEGEEVELMTPEGSVFVKAHLDEMIREGDVHLYHDWPEANGNDLMSGDYLDPISGFPGYRSLLCKVVPARMSVNAKEA